MGEERKGTKTNTLGRAPGAGRHAALAWGARLTRALVRPWPEMVGVDLGGASVKVAHLVRRGARIRNLRTTRKALAEVEGKQGDRRQAVRAALREAVRELGLNGKPAAVCVLGNEVMVRRLTLPPMPRPDIHSALLLECRKLVGFPVEEAELRYEVVGQARRDGVPELELLVTVARRRRIQEVRETLEAAGLRPSVITIVPVALQALLGRAGAIASDEVVAYLDMGATTTHILVLKGEEIRFSREFGVGGGTLTDALRSIIVRGRGTVELTAEEAEALKRDRGIPLGAEEAEFAAGIPLAAVSIMLRPILERLVRELWNSFDYCNEQYLGEAVTRIVLLGAGSRVRNLPDYLTGVLKIPVSRADLPEQVASRVGGHEVGDRGAASELALGLAHLPRGAVNFLTPANAGMPYRLAEAVPHQAAAVAAGLLVISIALPAQVGVVQERARLADMRVQLTSLAPRAGALQRFRAAREEETRLQDLLARLSGGQVLWSFVLRDLSHRVGEDVRLTELAVEEPAAGDAAQGAGRAVRLTGLLRTDHRRTEEVLAGLMQVLQQSPVLDLVRLEGCQSVDASRSTFTVSARLAE
jgi:type IV pilus assembly protein PilM